MPVGKFQGPIVPPPISPALNEKEQAKVKSEAARQSASDAARLASRAGFQRTPGAARKGLAVGDSSRAPIPLPEDDLDNAEWGQERLDSAQGSLSMAGTQFEECQKSEGPMAEAMTASSFLPTEEGVAELQLLADRPAPEPLPMDEVSTSVSRFFHIELTDKVPIGQRILAAGLVVAGEAGSVEAGASGLNEQKLASGLQRVTQRSNQAVGEAQRMNRGIDKERSVQRTFVFKR